MEDKYKENELSKSFYSLINAQSNCPTSKENQVSFGKIEPILKSEEGYHYLCPKCHIFPFIEFTKSKKYIKFTCLCYTDEKISIKDLFDKNYITISGLSDSNILSSTTINMHDADDCEGLKCKGHNRKFKYFCKTCLLNICEKCKNNYHDFKPHEPIEIKSMKIDNEKLNEIKNEINANNNMIYSDLNRTEIIKINFIDEETNEKVTEEEESKFNKLIRIIIHDYKNYPNFSHIFNIKNILHLFNLNKCEGKNDNNIKEFDNKYLQSKGKDEIIIKYINNNSTIKIFNEEFVKKNKDKVHLEINGKMCELISQYKPESSENILTIKLIVNEDIFEIDMSEMFANCINLISINGIGKWKKTKIINQYKMFYNCTSLLPIMDINDWKISTDVDNYLMFYNCISFIFIKNSIIKNIDDLDIKMSLGIIITKYLQNGKEILLKAKINKNEKKINLSKMDNAYNVVLDNGNDYDLVLQYEKRDEMKNNNLIIFYQDDINENIIEIEIILKIINKFNMNKLLFSLPDISK